MISIIMPVYNSIPFLKNAIEDILAQTYKDIELICVDDGSTDKSKEVLRYFMATDTRVTVFEQDHKGAGEARNYGMDHATGEFIIFLDADDRYRKNMLETLVTKAKESEADITLCDGVIFDDVSSIRMDSSWILRVDQIPSVCFEPKECSEHLFEITSGMPWNKLYRSDFVRCSGVRYKNTPFWNDTFFSFILLPAARKIAIVPDALVAYRVGNSGSITKSSRLKESPDAGFKLLEEIRDKLKSNGVYDVFMKTYARFVMEKFIQIINHINEDNYHLIFPYISSDYLDNFGVGLLKEDDFSNPDYYEMYRCIKEKGRDALICRMLSRITKAYDWYYEEKFKRDQIDSAGCREVFYYDLPNINKGSRIVLYGAGRRGRQIRERILRSGLLSIVAWVDAKYDELSATGEEIISINAIHNYEYDYVLIAVDSPDMMKEIKKKLIECGLEESRIVW